MEEPQPVMQVNNTEEGRCNEGDEIREVSCNEAGGAEEVIMLPHG